jgi:hypothetical protein
VPPFVAVAVNVTLVPAHIAPPGFAAMFTLAGKFELIAIVIVLDVAGEPVEHVAFDVMMHVMVFPFVSAALVYVELFVPTLLPFTCH